MKTEKQEQQIDDVHAYLSWVLGNQRMPTLDSENPTERALYLDIARIHCNEIKSLLKRIVVKGRLPISDSYDDDERNDAMFLKQIKNADIETDIAFQMFIPTIVIFIHESPSSQPLLRRLFPEFVLMIDMLSDFLDTI